MSDTILIVDDKDRVADRVRMALGEMPLSVHTVTDARAAKQLLVQSEISLIMIDVSLGDDERAGITLCRQLREHERFADIPVILLSDSLGDELIQLASDSGAQGLVGWPFPLESIKKRLLSLLSQKATSTPLMSDQITPAKAVASPKPAAGQALAAAAVAGGAAAPAQAASVEDKLKHAQHLLAMVLHNLKTSNLLDLVELEDIPDIVLKLTRTVCGEHSEPEPKVSAPKEKTSSEPEVSMDLDSVFGIKK